MIETEPTTEAAPPKPATKESGAQKKNRLRRVSPAAPAIPVARGRVRVPEQATYAAERAATREGPDL